MMALHDAARSGNLAEVKRLVLEGNIDFNACCDQRGGTTAMQCAVLSKQNDIVEYLHSSGASVNMTSTDGSSCLLYATFGGDYSLVKLLLSMGAKDVENLEGYTYVNNCAASQERYRCALFVFIAW